jgi:hypothetical protein
MKKQSPNSLWYLLGLRSSLSLRVSFLFIIPGALSPIFIDRASYGGPNWFWLLLIVTAHAAFTVSLLLCQRIVHQKRTDKSHPVQTIASFFVAQAVRGVVLGYGIVTYGLTDNPQLAFRILSGGVYIAMILSVIAIGVAVFDQHTGLVGNLQEQNFQLNALRNSLNSRLDSATESLQQFARNVVEPRIQQIDKSISDLKFGGDTQEAIENLRAYVDDELRPFSHEIAHGSSSFSVTGKPEPQAKSFRLPERINLGNAFRPKVTTMLFVITCVAAAQRSMTFTEALPFNTVSGVLILGYFLSLRHLFRNVYTSFWISFLIAIPIFALISPVVLWIDQILGIAIPEFITQASSILGVIFAVANVSYSFLTAQRENLVEELSIANAELSSIVSVISQKEWLARRRVSFVMHGSLQSALNAAALRLGANPNPDAILIENIREDIAKALKRIGFEGLQEYAFETAKQEISEIWVGTIEIDWDVAPDVDLRLSQNPTTSECIAEVLREAVSNASKHGSATAIEISIAIQGESVEVQVKDNGSAKNTGITQGLGSELMDDVCDHWKLSPTNSGGMSLYASLVLEH